GVDPAVGIRGIDLRDLEERRFRTPQVSLEQQADPIVVPPLPVLRKRRRGGGVEGFPWARYFQVDLRRREGDDWQVRYLFQVARDVRGVAFEDPTPVVEIRARGVLLLLWVANAGEG